MLLKFVIIWMWIDHVIRLRDDVNFFWLVDWLVEFMALFNAKSCLDIYIKHIEFVND